MIEGLWMLFVIWLLIAWRRGTFRSSGPRYYMSEKNKKIKIDEMKKALVGVEYPDYMRPTNATYYLDTKEYSITFEWEEDGETIERELKAKTLDQLKQRIKHFSIMNDKDREL